MPPTRTPKELRLDPDEVERWWARLVRAYRARKPHKNRWDELREYYIGNYFNEPSVEDRVSSMLHFAQTRQMASNLYFQDPTMQFTGRTQQGIADAKVSESLLRLERKIIKSESQERRMVDFALFYGTGILKHGWNTRHGIEPAFSDKKKRGIDSSQHSLDRSAGHEDLGLPLGPWTEHNTSVTFGHPWVKAVRPIDFLVDADAYTYEEASWVCERFQRRWVDAIRDERWDSEARKALEEAGPTGQSPHFTGELDDEWRDDDEVRDSSLTTFYEIWDKTTQRIIVINDSVEIPMEVKPYPFLGKDGPYEILQFFPRDDTFWAIPYMDTFTPEVLAMNKINTRSFDHNQRWGRTRGGYDPGRIDPEAIERLAASKEGEFVPVRLDIGMKISDVLDTLEEIPVSPDNFRLYEVFKSAMREISGITENDLGSGKGIQTATEASIIQQQTGLRKGDMRFRVDAALSGSARKTMALLRQFFRGEQVIPVVGPEGQQWNQQVTTQVLNGEFDVDIEPGSTERVDRQARFKQTIELFREALNAQQFLQAQGFQINLGELFKLILVEAEIVKNPDRIVIPFAPQPQLGVQGQLPSPQQQIAQTPGLSTVNAQDRIPQTTEAFGNGRASSELQGARFN